MRRTLLLPLTLVFCAAAQPASERIGTIDFYGYGVVDVAPLRAVLPFHEGDKVPTEAVRKAAKDAVNAITAREVALNVVCCLEDGRSEVFIGLAEPDAPPVQYNAAPTGDSRLPAEVLKIFPQLDKHLWAAIKRGTNGEDDSQGYALAKDSATRADQQKLRKWARANTDTILHVIEDARDAGQRKHAVEALGYADRSPRQIAALVSASFDADDGVRNDAVRALGVLCNLGSEVTRQIPAARFTPLLHSLAWTDRNKGSFLLERVTESRDPALLKTIHDQALVPLREMAGWHSLGHASPALMILGRMIGLSEVRLRQMNAATVAEILKTIR